MPYYLVATATQVALGFGQVLFLDARQPKPKPVLSSPGVAAWAVESNTKPAQHEHLELFVCLGPSRRQVRGPQPKAHRCTAPPMPSRETPIAPAGTHTGRGGAATAAGAAAAKDEEQPPPLPLPPTVFAIAYRLSLCFSRTQIHAPSGGLSWKLPL